MRRILAPWLEQTMNAASNAHFGAPVGYIGQGGTIPLMSMLQQGFPRAQMMVCGVLGPKSNAHGPNEFLHVPTARSSPPRWRRSSPPAPERPQVVGIEQSPEMIALARERVKGRRWRNVRLIAASVEAAQIGVSADAALFHFTHDVLRRPEAVANVLHHLRPGARVVASGLKWAGRRSPVNLLVWPAALHSVTSLEGSSRPWSHLQPALEDFRVRSTLLGGVYIASGTLRGR
jgi:hypothetical protein